MTLAISTALVAYVCGTIVGMVAGSLVPFALSVVPLVVFSGICAGLYAAAGREWTARERFFPVMPGALWGSLSGAFATSTCGPTHTQSLIGSDVAAVVVGLVAIALVIVSDMLPRTVASRPHALCGLLFVATVAFALALGAEVPAWPR